MSLYLSMWILVRVTVSNSCMLCHSPIVIMTSPSITLAIYHNAHCSCSLKYLTFMIQLLIVFKSWPHILLHSSSNHMPHSSTPPHSSSSCKLMEWMNWIWLQMLNIRIAPEGYHDQGDQMGCLMRFWQGVSLLYHYWQGVHCCYRTLPTVASKRITRGT